MRWRLRRMGNNWRAFWRRGEQTVGHIRYEHKTCGECGAVQDRDAKVCTSCEAPMAGRSWQVLERLGVSAPSILSVSALLGVMFAVAYFQLVRANGGGGIISIKQQVLFEHGAYDPVSVSGGDWWLLVTACFMHSGLWHIGFNLFALAVVGPRVSEQFGSFATVFLFLVTGVIGNMASGAFDIPAVGASGGIMGLIGAAAAAGHQEGTSIGRELRNDMLKWTAYVYFFSFLIGANHAAHTGGLFAGAVFGWFVKPHWMKLRTVRPIAAVVGIVCLVCSAWATYAVLVPPKSVYLSRLYVEFEREHRRNLEPAIRLCTDAPDTPGCDELEQRRRQCAHGVDGFVAERAPMEARTFEQARCDVLGPPTGRP